MLESIPRDLVKDYIQIVSTLSLLGAHHETEFPGGW